MGSRHRHHEPYDGGEKRLLRARRQCPRDSPIRRWIRGGDPRKRHGRLHLQKWRTSRLDRGVLPSPITANIISIGQLDEAGCRIELEHGVLRIFEPGRKLLARVEHSASCLYLINLNIGRPVCLSVRSDETAWRWHARFGHLSFQSLRRLANHDMVRGLPPIEPVEQVCDA